MLNAISFPLRKPSDIIVTALTCKIRSSPVVMGIGAAMGHLLKAAHASFASLTYFQKCIFLVVLASITYIFVYGSDWTAAHCTLVNLSDVLTGSIVYFLVQAVSTDREHPNAQAYDPDYMILWFHIISSFVGIVALLLMEWNRRTRKLLAHKSLILLMNMHTFWTFLLCISTFLNNSFTMYDNTAPARSQIVANIDGLSCFLDARFVSIDSSLTMHAHLRMRKPSDIFVTASTCAMRRAPLIVAAYGAIFSQCAMAAERCRASANLAGYENAGRRAGHLMNAAHLAASALFGGVHMAFYGSEWTAAHCTMITPDGGNVHTTIPMITIVSEIVTIVSFKRLLARNQKMHSRIEATLTLSERYQLAENIRMLKLLLPIIWSHTLLGIAGSALFLICTLIFHSNDLYPLVEESACTLYLQGIIMPLIFWIRVRERKRHEQEVRVVNITRGEALATYHTQAITENCTRRLLAHKSLLVLIDFHAFWTLVLCLSTLANSALTMHAHLTMRNPSDLFVTASTCAVRRAPLIFAAYGAIFSQCAMAAERCRASANFAGYEYVGRRAGHLLNAAHLAASSLFGGVHMAFYGSEWTAAHCTMITPDGGNVHTTIPIQKQKQIYPGIIVRMITIIAEIITIVSFKRLLSRNQKVHARIEANVSSNGEYPHAQAAPSDYLVIDSALFFMKSSHTLLGIAGSVLFLICTLIFHSNDLYPLVEVCVAVHVYTYAIITQETACTLYLQGIIMPLIFWIRVSERKRHEQEVRAVNMTRGEALATYHTQAITENCCVRLITRIFYSRIQQMSFHIIVSSTALLALLHILWNRKEQFQYDEDCRSQVTDFTDAFHTFWTFAMCIAIFVNNMTTVHTHLTMSLVQIMSFHIITSSAGTIALICLEWNRKTRKLLAHKSLLLLMNAHSFWTFLLCLSSLANNAINLYEHVTARLPRDILVPATTCILRRAPSIFAIYGAFGEGQHIFAMMNSLFTIICAGSIFSQMAMAAERYRASTNLAAYEYTSRATGHWLNAAHVRVYLISGRNPTRASLLTMHGMSSLFCVASEHILAIPLYWLLLTYLYGDDWIATHCTLVNPSNEVINTIIAMVIILCEVIIILSFKSLLSRNIRLRDNTNAGLTLSERFQLTENIRMLKLLSPIIWTHTSFGMIGAIVYVVLKLIIPAPGMYPLIEESINMLELQGLCIPIIFMHRLRAERRHEQEIHDVNTTTGEVLTSHHMKTIKEGWNCIFRGINHLTIFLEITALTRSSRPVGQQFISQIRKSKIFNYAIFIGRQILSIHIITSSAGILALIHFEWSRKQALLGDYCPNYLIRDILTYFLKNPEVARA
ncbi:hypothetical protein PRIPAC_82242 [Pristionchus pacificus]|uniref:G protein-coupled receptor n=1 Tax=Pristionchus pacificus TaxID=54126 RepID=A0A2A6CNM9_PRIPA|nr:hypothetical protein PRIPAC_82242 [Pristionchus pacificus]|eukprot:PDM79663.1 G protein-coupled receptor [Pristionchus pacificus]